MSGKTKGLKEAAEALLKVTGKTSGKKARPKMTAAELKALAKKRADNLKENQKGAINKLEGMSATEKADAGIGEASKGRLKLAELGGRSAGQKKAYNEKVKLYNSMKDKSSEKAQLLLNSIKDMQKRIGKDILGFNKGGTPVSKKATMDDAVKGMSMKQLTEKMSDPKTPAPIKAAAKRRLDRLSGADKTAPLKKMSRGGKVTMMRGGMANGKEHMYAAGGMVNDGLKALKKASPEAYKKITGK